MKNKKWVIGASLLCLISFSVILWAQKGERDKEGKLYGETGPIVVIQEITRGELKEVLPLTGVITALDKKTLYAETEDEVTIVPKRIGDSVKKGEVILSLKGENQEATLRQLENLEIEIKNEMLTLQTLVDADNSAQIIAGIETLSSIEKGQKDLDENLRRIEESIALAKVDLTRLQKTEATNEELWQNDLLSQDAKEKLEKEVALKKEEVESLKGQLALLQEEKGLLALQKEKADYNLEVLRNPQINKDVQKQVEAQQNKLLILQNKKKDLEEELLKMQTQILSPMEGVVAKLYVEVGQKVKPDEALIEIVNDENLIIKADVAPEDSSYIALGQPCHMEYLGKELVEGEGVIKRIAPRVITEEKGNGSVKKKLPIEIELTSLSQKLLDGLEVDIEITTLSVSDGLIIPKAAIYREAIEAYYVYVVDEEGKVEKKKVELKESTEDQAVVEGVIEGEKLIVEKGEEVGVGSLVRYSF